MELSININDPDILRGYVRQASSQLGLGNGKITVGREGGLALHLFEFKASHYLPGEPRMDTPSQMNAWRIYFSAVQEYVDFADSHAKLFDFRTVMLDGSRDILDLESTHDSSTYQRGIGSRAIESAERFKKFMVMVKEGEGELNSRYNQLVKLARELPGQPRT